MPPRLARQLLRRLLPAADRDVIVGDLDEEFLARRARGDAARLWYWRQALMSAASVLRPRLGASLAQVPGDVRFALRVWRRHKIFASTAILTQATGIAVAIAVFGVAYTVLLRPLPYADADRLVQILEGDRSGQFSYPDFVDFTRATRTFDAIAGFSGGSRTLTSPGSAPERIISAEVTARFFDVLGVPPMMGRTFTTDDTRRDAPGIVILTHGAWTRRFGADPSAVGRSVMLNGLPHTIVGVLPRAFVFPLRGAAEIWLPLRPSPQQEERGYMHWLDVIGRVRPGATQAEIQADVDAIAGLFASRDAKWHAGARLSTEALREVIVGGVRPTIETLLAGVLLLLLATCATIAGLLLSRASEREREFAVRAAIGAKRGRLVRQLLTENILLAVAGGAAGLLAAHALLQWFVASIPAAQRASIPHIEQVGIHPAVAAAGITLSLVTGIVFGVLPAVRAVRAGNEGVHGARVTAGRAETRLRMLLVAGQVAVALVLLAGATLVAASVHRLLNVSTGFDPEGLVTMRLTLSPKYAQPAAVNTFHDALQEQVSGISGVTGVAAIDQAPLTGRGNNGSPSIVGSPLPPGASRPEVSLRTVTPNYFQAMRIPLLRGRGFQPSDTDTSPGVILVNDLAARQLFGDEDPLGQRITFEFAPGPWTIVGVVGTERFDYVDQPLLPVVYFAQRQDVLRAFTLIVRTTQPASLPADVRRVVERLDPELPIFAVRTIEQITAGSSAVFLRRMAMWLLGVFAVAAVLLAALALYGVLAQVVAERRREIGVRMALGATRADIFRLILGRGLLATALGLTAGGIAAAMVSRLLSSLLFEVRPGDPVIIGASVAFLLGVTLAACLVPATRATRIDPADAIRSD